MELEWVPSAEQPLRVAEFDALFATATSVERVAPGEPRFALPPDVVGTAAALAARETGAARSSRSP